MPTPAFDGVEEFRLESRHADRIFRIGLKRPGRPPAAQTSPANCPILIMLDSFMTFGTAIDCAGSRSLMGDIEPVVVVGVGYPVDAGNEGVLRTRDMTPSASAGPNVPGILDAMIGAERGGAEAFLAFLLDELVPAIVERVPEASAERRILFGHSLSGLFASHVLTTRPDAFETFVMSSPSLWWDDFEVPRRLGAFGQRLLETDSTPRVLVSVGSREQDPPKDAIPGIDAKEFENFVRHCRMVDAAADFADGLRSAGVRDVRSVVFTDEDHGSVVSAAIGRAVTFALGTRKP